MQGEEAGKRQISQCRPGTADGNLQQALAHQRQKGEEAGSGFRRGVAVLVPRQQIAGQNGRQRTESQADGGPEDQFARARQAPVTMLCTTWTISIASSTWAE